MGHRNYSLAKHTRMLLSALGGTSILRVAEEERVCPKTVTRLLERFNRGESLVPRGNKGKQHRDRALTPYLREWLLRIFQMDDELYVDEAHAHLLRITGQHVSRSSVWRGLKELGLTRKTKVTRAREADPAKQQEYVRMVCTLFFRDQLLFLDESGVNDRAYRRTRCRAPKGQRSQGRTFFSRGKRVSVLPIVSSEGILDYYLTPGGVNTAKLLDFTKRVLVPVLRPFPEKHSVVVLDNFVTHHNQEVVDTIQATGAVVIYLSPYSPEFSPAELVFNTMKSYIKRHRDPLEKHPADPFQALHDALGSITPEKCDRFFDKAGSYHADSNFYVKR